MTSTTARIRSWETNHKKATWWINAIARSFFGVLAGIAAVCTLIYSTDSASAPEFFQEWTPQILRDFSVLMVTYALLCFIQQADKAFRVDALNVFVSFAVWAAGFLLLINGRDIPGFSFAAVVISIGFLVFGPVFKGDTKTIYHSYPHTVQAALDHQSDPGASIPFTAQ